MKFLLLYAVLLVIILQSASGQLEHVPVSHPVYDFLLQCETRGAIEHISLSSLPLQREEIVNALKNIRGNNYKLKSSEIETLDRFETEFQLKPRDNSVVIFSKSDSLQVLSVRIIGNDEKFIYHYADSSNSVSVSPLASIQAIAAREDNSYKNVQLGVAGVRLFGTIDNSLGYFLQATNGAKLGGDRALALEDPYLRQNIKFAELNSDFDFTESHILYRNKWFYATIGRESRYIGAGTVNHLFVSRNSPAIDALSFGASFEGFEYRFTHASLLAIPDDNSIVGVATKIQSKYLAMHSFVLKPLWGELAFWEGIVYSNREVDLAYLNPLSFLKSLEHALHDRDNSLMGGWTTLRFFDNIQFKGSYILDDIIFSKIGKSFWSNKTAWNASILYSLPFPLTIGIEYARIEPYTFSHFNFQNSYTNDKSLIGTELFPNSDELACQLYLWLGGRYPVKFRFSYIRHGENIYDENGEIIKNVGGDPLQTKRSEDPETVIFLDGKRVNTLSALFQGGLELVRGFNLQGYYKLLSVDEKISHSIGLTVRFEDF